MPPPVPIGRRPLGLEKVTVRLSVDDLAILRQVAAREQLTYGWTGLVRKAVADLVQQLEHSPPRSLAELDPAAQRLTANPTDDRHRDR